MFIFKNHTNISIIKGVGGVFFLSTNAIKIAAIFIALAAIFIKEDVIHA